MLPPVSIVNSVLYTFTSFLLLIEGGIVGKSVNAYSLSVSILMLFL